jgi:uncharacterized protein
VRAPERPVVDAVVALGRALRATGVAVSVDEEILLCRALAEVDLRDRTRVYWAARAALLSRREEAAMFDSLFERFWAGLALELLRGAEHGESDPRMPGPQHGGESLPQFRLEGRSSQLVGGQPTRASHEIPTAAGERTGEGRRHGVLAAYSPEEVLTERRPIDYREEELAALRRLAEELRTAAPQRRSRRLRPVSRPGRLDLQRTMRRCLETDGEPVRPGWAASSHRPRRIVVLCDVSGSMERYSRALLASLQTVVAAGIKAEAFAFATRLTRLTVELSGHHVGRTLREAREAVEDWSGGTRIGAALADFDRRYGRRGLVRGAIVLIVSDGWDRGDPSQLVRELERLRLAARRLIWFNPRPSGLDGQPLAVGLRAALPYVDDYVPGGDPRSVAALSRLIREVGDARPARRQRPVALAAR